jgi:hypothetical protein
MSTPPKDRVPSRRAKSGQAHRVAVKRSVVETIATIDVHAATTSVGPSRVPGKIAMKHPSPAARRPHSTTKRISTSSSMPERQSFSTSRPYRPIASHRVADESRSRAARMASVERVSSELTASNELSAPSVMIARNAANAPCVANVATAPSAHVAIAMEIVDRVVADETEEGRLSRAFRNR